MKKGLDLTDRITEARYPADAGSERVRLCGVCSLRHFRRRRRYSLSISGVAAAPRGGPAISFLCNDGGAGRGVCEVWGQRRRAARNRWPWWLSGVFSLWIFRLARRYSLSISGVAAAPRGGPAISFLCNDGGAGRGVCEVWGQRRRAARNRWPWWLSGVFSLWIFRLARRYSLSISGVAAAPRGGPAISFLCNDGGAGRAMGSASPRPGRTGVGMALRRVFSLNFPAGGIVLFIHWRVVAAPRGGPAI